MNNTYRQVSKTRVPISDVCHDVRRKSGDEFNTPQKWVSEEDKGKIGHESWKGIVNNEQRYPSWQLLIDEQVHPTVSLILVRFAEGKVILNSFSLGKLSLKSMKLLFRIEIIEKLLIIEIIIMDQNPDKMGWDIHTVLSVV